MGHRSGRGRGALIVTDSVFSMDGDVALERSSSCRAPTVGCWSTRRTGPARSAGRPRRARRSGPRGSGRRDRRDARQGARVLRRVRRLRPGDGSVLVNAARTFIFSTALPPPATAGALAALEILEEQPRRVAQARGNAAALRSELEREGFDLRGSRTQIMPLVVGDAERAMRICEAALARRRVRPGDPAADGPADDLAAALAVMATHRADGAARRGAHARGAVSRRRLRAGRGSAGPRRDGVAPPPDGAVRRRGVGPGWRRRASDRRVRGLFCHRHRHRVGKTVVAAAIVAALRARGIAVPRAQAALITASTTRLTRSGRPTTSCSPRSPADGRARSPRYATPRGVPASGRRARREPTRRAARRRARPPRGSRSSSRAWRSARAFAHGYDVRDWPPRSGCRCWSPPAPGSGRSTTRC